MNYNYQPKPEFVKRISKLLPDKKECECFWKIIRTGTLNSMRCNTLKISLKELKKRLEARGWKIKQPFSEHLEVMIVENRLGPGELGKAKEHLLGYYYVQDISSMLPVLALKPQAGEIVLDLCASPGSKTTQAACMMENRGTIIANDNNLGRIKILESNLRKCGVMNVIITKKDGVRLCERFLEKTNLRFDKILCDVPCTGEGTLRKSPKTFLMWNLKMIKNLSKLQRTLAGSALKVLKSGGEMIYSTCTLAPEENEEVIDYLIKNFNIIVEKVELPLKTREGVVEWGGKKFSEEVRKCVRVYPHDNDTDGFFLCKLRKEEKGGR